MAALSTAKYAELRDKLVELGCGDFTGLLEALNSGERTMQRRWPQAVDLMFMRLPPKSVWTAFPLLFRRQFAAIDEDRLLPFIAGCKLVVSAATTADKIFDDEIPRMGPSARSDTAHLLLRWQGLQFELHRCFSHAFDARSPFWDHFQTYLAEYTGCIATELRYAVGRRRLVDATDAECLAIATAKTCLSRIAIVGLALLADDWTMVDRLVLSLDRFNVAKQLLDDLIDWKTDIGKNSPTLVMVRLARASIRTDGGEGAPSGDAIAREIYYGGHAGEVLELAGHYARGAIEAAGVDAADPWSRLVHDLHREIERLRSDLTTTIRANVSTRSAARVLAAAG